MTAYVFIYLALLCGVPISILDNARLRRASQIVYLSALLLALTLFAGLRSPYVDGDSFNYIERFQSLGAGPLDIGAWLKDPAFVLVSLLATSAGIAYYSITLIYAGLALSAQLYFSYFASSARWMTLFVYLLLCRFYIVGEMNQISAAVAIPLMSLSIYWACSGQNAKSVFVYIVALSFHISAILGLPILVLILMGIEFRSRKWVISIIPLTLVAYFLLNGILQRLSGYARFYRYIENPELGNTTHLLSLHLLIHVVAVAWILLFYWNRLSLFHRVAAVCTSIGISLFVLFLPLSDVAYRLEDVFDFFWIVLLVVIAEKLRGWQRLTYFCLLVIVGGGLYYVSLKDIGPYMLWSAAH